MNDVPYNIQVIKTIHFYTIVLLCYIGTNLTELKMS